MEAKNGKAFSTVDEYIDMFSPHVQELLETMRSYVKEAAPGAEEVISYGMPAIKQHGVLVYYAGYKGHIGFYPTGAGIKAFENELTAYKTSKGAIQFPIDKPIPKSLVKKIVKYRVKEDAERAQLKKVKKAMNQ